MQIAVPCEVEMKPRDVMKGAPPSAEALVIRFNWRKYPYSQWSFRNVRQVLPTADIRRASTLSPLTSSVVDLGTLGSRALAVTASNNRRFPIPHGPKCLQEFCL